MVVFSTKYKKDLKMKNAQSNSIANIAKTLGVPSKAGKSPSIRKGINAKTTIGESLIIEHTLGFVSGVVTAESGRIKMTDSAKALHLGGVRLLKASTAEGKKDKTTQLVRKAFFDGFIGQVSPTTRKEYAKGYIDTQYQVFFEAVNSGKPITDLNADRAKAKANGKPAKANDDDAKMISALKNVWVLSSVATSAIDFIQDKLDDGFSMVQAIEDYLQSEGIEITKDSE
jgi:hypothetical protein